MINKLSLLFAIIGLIIFFVSLYEARQKESSVTSLWLTADYTWTKVGAALCIVSVVVYLLTLKN